MKRRCVIDEAIGETRAAVWEGKALTELYVRRWTDADVPRLGDIYAGRVRRIEPSLGAAFIDMGTAVDGFLKFTASHGAPRLTEGLGITVEITREPEAEKGPNVRFSSLSNDTKEGRISGHSLREFIESRYPGILFEMASVGTLLEAAETDLAIPGGGTLTIERTKALTAIDIDSGAAPSPFSVAKAACPMIAAQLRLRGIGGLIAIDFPNLRQKRQREQIMQSLEDAFEHDRNMVKFAPLSRFGVIEMTRSRSGPSIDETLLDKFGQQTIETQALEALRLLQRTAHTSRGAQVEMMVLPQVFEWLETEHIDWKAPLNERIGERYTIIAGQALSVTADR